VSKSIAHEKGAGGNKWAKFTCLALTAEEPVMYQLVAARSGASNAGRHILPKSRSNHLTVLCGVINNIVESVPITLHRKVTAEAQVAFLTIEVSIAQRVPMRRIGSPIPGNPVAGNGESEARAASMDGILLAWMPRGRRWDRR
jgi:hypothetical protein